MNVGILVAMSPDRVIGRDDKIPWYYSEDLKRFKRITTGGAVIMGRRTWDSLPKKPLPDRDNYVISSQNPDHPLTRTSLKETIAEALEQNPYVWLIGGAQIYEEGLEYAQLIDMTVVPDRPPVEGSVLFPELDSVWTEIHCAPLEGCPFLSRLVLQRSL